MNLAFNRSVAPRLLKGCKEGDFVAAWMFCNSGQRAGSSDLLPLRLCRGIALPDDAEELTRCCGKGSDSRRTATQLIQ